MTTSEWARDGARARPLRFGVFMAPFHRSGHNTALAIESDLRSVEVLDSLGYDQVWFGEHHSSGYEIYPSPEIMIAAAAQRTARIELCSGVISLPYHHPMIVADRMAFLDHMTRGRLICGVGPGALPSDSAMMGIDYNCLRTRMDEALTAILALLDSDEPVTMSTDWFELRDAQLQHQSYRSPRLKMAVASALSPSGPRLAGRNGIGLVSFGGTSEGALDVLASTWDVMSEQAMAYEQPVSRDDWAIVGMMHVAPTEAEAREETRSGLKEFFDYRHAASPFRLYDDDGLSHNEIVDCVNAKGAGVIGTPDMAVEFVNKLLDRTGGFGTLLFNANDWSDPAATRRSWELFAREVAPTFDGRSLSRVRSHERVMGHKQELVAQFLGGIQLAKDSYDAERKQSGISTHGREDIS